MEKTYLSPRIFEYEVQFLVCVGPAQCVEHEFLNLRCVGSIPTFGALAFAVFLGEFSIVSPLKLSLSPSHFVYYSSKTYINTATKLLWNSSSLQTPAPARFNAPNQHVFQAVGGKPRKHGENV